ncbi:hypothetical protein TNIN_492831 [Trichonephila inaurata madagascariensis]|uniref:Uncharacterized protein n=1 Tax=Trichonephila inaurata madagascariensis TaxID=2747483 RepID=A0A8X6WTA9_9ARAC|nr:hypothetical protein TNIN_492831 [Trichonephila inaurata madagascariensis]
MVLFTKGDLGKKGKPHVPFTDEKMFSEKKLSSISKGLQKDELLERCSAGGKNQKSNESIHSVILGKNAQKKLLFPQKRLEMCVISAIGGYNFGFLPKSLAIEHNELSAISVENFP